MSSTPPSAQTGTDAPLVSVVVVSYNVCPFLIQALDALERAALRVAAEIIVVDNASSDGSTDAVATRFPGIRLIRNAANRGFSVANNQGIRASSGRYILVLNPDTVVSEDTLSEMAAYMEAHPEVGALGCRIINPDGSFAPESRRAFPTPSVAFYRVVGLSRVFPRSRRFGRYNLSYLSPDDVTDVDALSGSCMMVRRATIDGTSEHPPAGFFDESFFMYGEDLDWCYRIQQSGWIVRYAPVSTILHYKGESSRNNDFRYVRLFYGAMLKFADKYPGTRYSRSFTAVIKASILSVAGLSAVSHGLVGLLNGDNKPIKGVPVCVGNGAQGIGNILGPVTSASTDAESINKVLDRTRSRTVVFEAESLAYGEIIGLLQRLKRPSLRSLILSPDRKWLVGKGGGIPLP